MKNAAYKKVSRMEKLFASIGTPKFNDIPTCVGLNCPLDVFSKRLRTKDRSNNEGRCGFTGEAKDVLVGSSVCPIEPSTKER